jgi:hypothetical protein
MKRHQDNKKKYMLLPQIFLLMLFLIPAAGSAQIKAIWALGDGEKIFRNDLDHPDKNGNFTWDGKTIRLKGLYNEVLAFQIILETGIDSAKNIVVAVDNPLNKKSGKSIGGNTLKYGPAGTIEIFTQHYLHVREKYSTPPAWFYGSPAAAPAKMTGWIPDALIPADALPGRGGFPLDIGPSQNQGFWVDISLPRDQNYPSGVYSGNVQIIQEGKLVKEIPLEVTLLPDYLPDENAANVWLFTSGVNAYYPELPREHVDKMIKFEGHRHRINVTGGLSVNTSPFNAEKMEAYKPFLNGKGYTPANGYYGPGQGVGEKIFPIGMYGGTVLGNTKESIQQQSNLWVEWFNNNAPDVTYFQYVVDEPGEEKHGMLKEHAQWIKSNNGAGKSLPLFTTTHYQPALVGAIDIWAAYNGVELEHLPEIRKTGGDHWFYNGNRPRYGSVILEGTAVDLRVNSWILYKYDVNTHFIWHGTHWRHNGNGFTKMGLHQNMFQNPNTYAGGGSFGNGDGILFYPGRMPFYPEEDRGLNKIIPSIRVKNIRRGQQDAVIMKMAEQKVGREKVIRIINKVVPKALSEVSMDEAVPWSEKGSDYAKVREELLELL